MISSSLLDMWRKDWDENQQNCGVDISSLTGPLSNASLDKFWTHRYFGDAHSFFQGIFDVYLWP
jgi:hypothetical protein